MFEAYADDPNFEAWFIIAENRRSDAPSQADCERIASSNGLTSMRVLRAASTQQLDGVGLGHRHTHYVLVEGARVFHTSRFTDNQFEDALQQALAR